jgi:hypothetical protein
VLRSFIGSVIGGLLGLGAGALVLTIATAGVSLGRAGGGDMSGPFLMILVVFGFGLAGLVLGLLIGAWCRSRRSLLGVGTGTTAGYAAGLAVVFAGNRVVAANQPQSSSENFNQLALYSALGLLCVVIGAASGAVVTKARASDKNEPS